MFLAAARALAECSPAPLDPAGPLLPPLSASRRLSRAIALAVVAQREGLAEARTAEETERLIDAKMWEPPGPHPPLRGAFSPREKEIVPRPYATQ